MRKIKRRCPGKKIPILKSPLPTVPSPELTPATPLTAPETPATPSAPVLTPAKPLVAPPQIFPAKPLVAPVEKKEESVMIPAKPLVAPVAPVEKKEEPVVTPQIFPAKPLVAPVEKKPEPKVEQKPNPLNNNNKPAGNFELCIDVCLMRFRIIVWSEAATVAWYGMEGQGIGCVCVVKEQHEYGEDRYGSLGHEALNILSHIVYIVSMQIL
jgi:hypothetical protein